MKVIRMTRQLDSEITISATAQQVWAVLTDFQRYPAWNPFIREAGGELREGGRLNVRIQPPGSGAMTFRPIVQTLTPGARLSWLGHLLYPGLFDGEHVFEIVEEAAGRVRFRQSERFSGLLVPFFPSSLYEKTQQGFALMNQALKQRVERGVLLPDQDDGRALVSAPG